jgi:L-ascorbate metabolism protein UlaG (beta-lactamase superfamily)
MSIRFRWLGYVCFEIVLPSGRVLVVDPYIDYSSTAPVKCSEVTGADYIAVTHGHFDHVTDIGPLVDRFDSKVICSHQVAGPLAELFALDEARIIRVTAGDTVEFDDLTVEVRRGEHIDLSAVMAAMYERATGRKPDPDLTPARIMEAVGPLMSQGRSPELAVMMDRIREVGLNGGEQLTFVFQTAGNLRTCVYSSDAYDFLRQEVIDARANVFMAQLGGVRPAKAAEMAALSGAEIVVPMHHDGNGADLMRRSSASMARRLATRCDARFLDIVAGQWYEVGVTATPIEGV